MVIKLFYHFYLSKTMSIHQSNVFSLI